MAIGDGAIGRELCHKVGILMSERKTLRMNEKRQDLSLYSMSLKDTISKTVSENQEENSNNHPCWILELSVSLYRVV